MSISRYAERLLDRMQNLQQTGETVSRSIHRGILKGGPLTRQAADALHGTWLGHPLHVVLTDVVIGSWVAGAVFDVMALSSGDKRAQWAGDALAMLGTAAAVPTALTGLVDYSTVPKPAAGAATLHAVLNEVNVVLYAVSIRERRKGRHSRGIALSLGAVALSAASAWLGGHLVYAHNVGADHSPSVDDEGWTDVASRSDLPNRKPVRRDYGDAPVLLYRNDDAIYAIASTCAHAGGPLDEGHIEGCTVQCPWHDSVFDLRDGAIVHGPSVHPQPAFDTRIRDGRVEIRPRSGENG